MQASAGARKYAGEVFLEHLIKAAIESYRIFRSVCIRTTARVGCLPRRHQPRILFCDDGRLSDERRQDDLYVRLQRQRHQRSRQHGS